METKLDGVNKENGVDPMKMHMTYYTITRGKYEVLNYCMN